MTESVWAYPRPPALLPCTRRVRVELGGVVVADSTAALRILETSHPPAIYVPPADVTPGCIEPAAGRSSLRRARAQITPRSQRVDDDATRLGGALTRYGCPARP